MELMTMGPFWFSALKFEAINLNSETMSEFGFTGRIAVAARVGYVGAIRRDVQ
jgi:hypothetical protein